MAKGKKNGEANGDEIAGNLTKETFVEHYTHISNLSQELADVSSDLRNAYKTAEEVGIDRKQLKRAMKMQKQDSGKTEAELRALRLYMGWLDMPIGTQAALFGEQEAGAHADA